MRNKKLFSFLIAFSYLVLSLAVTVQALPAQQADEQKILQTLHSISSHKLFDYVKELASDKYAGRLTGTEEYNASAEWVASHFKDWGIAPVGDNGTYFQAFPIPYTLVFEDCEVYLHIPYKDSVLKKYYRYEDEFIPGPLQARERLRPKSSMSATEPRLLSWAMTIMRAWMSKARSS